MTAQLNGRWDASAFFENLCATNRLARHEGFTFCRVSGLDGFEEAVNTMQTASAFVCVSDIADGYTELNNTPRTRRVKTVFIFTRNARGDVTECTRLMKELGLDAVRLRVWVDPKDGFSSKEDVLVMAKRAKALDMAIMIDFHYSDWWADPGKQNIPDAWKGMNVAEMQKALDAHTKETLQLLKDNDIEVKWVQVGNETTHGFLWPVGRAEENMENYARLTRAGYDAVKEIYPNAAVIIHLDNGYDRSIYDFIFDGLRKHGAAWDMIGMSLYPYWTVKNDPSYTEPLLITRCADNMKYLKEKYGTPVMLVETGYKADRPEAGKAYLSLLIEHLAENTGGVCEGVFYWAAETCHGGYDMGAFADDMPTVMMDAFTEASHRLGKSKQ